MFVREKTVSGKRYGYLVESSWKKGGTRQKVKKYLGRVIEPREKERPPFREWRDVDLEPYVSNTPFRQVIRDLIRYEKEMHDIPEEVKVTKNGNVRKGKRDAVLALNEGYLCGSTASRLLNANPVEEERRGEHLAELLSRAGLKIEKQMFILLYRKLYNV